MNVVKESKARSTGTYVALIDNRDGSFENVEDPTLEDDVQAMVNRGSRWATLCENHASYVLHGTRALATAFMAAPEEWCCGCQDERDA